MRRKLLFLGVLFMFFGLAVAGRYFYLKTQIKEGRLKILSSPVTQVILDDDPVGKTPFEKTLREGEYLLKLVGQGEATSSATWNGKVTINPNALTVVDWQLGVDDLSTSGVILSIVKMSGKAAGDTGEIEVDTEPIGSIVYLDNEEHGIAPMILSGVSSGDHELSVFNPGFFRRTQKINVESGYRVKASFKLAMDPTYKRVETPKEDTEKKATEEATLKQDYVEIKETETGWLRVRDKAGTGGTEVAKVNPGDIFKIVSTEAGWYEIEYTKGKTGWVSGQYVTKTTAPKTATTTPSPSKPDESL